MALIYLLFTRLLLLQLLILFVEFHPRGVDIGTQMANAMSGGGPKVVHERPFRAGIHSVQPYNCLVAFCGSWTSPSVVVLGLGWSQCTISSGTAAPSWARSYGEISGFEGDEQGSILG